MYSETEWTLQRIFGLEFELSSRNPIGRMIPDRTRKKPSGITRIELIGDDGAARRELREAMPPLLYGVLVLRFGYSRDDHNRYWEHLKHELKVDARLVKNLRNNPVLLRLFMGWHIRHPDLRQGKLQYKTDNRMTLSRWNRACEEVAQEWIERASYRAFDELAALGKLNNG